MMKIRNARGLLVLLALVALLAGCGHDHDKRSSAPNPLELGPYPVGVTRIELFDEARGRTLLTEIWYPADESARGQEPAPATSFLPEGLESLAENATIPLLAVRDASISPNAPFPLIAFSHGSGGVRYQNSFQCDYLASHGYVVIAPDHQGNTFFDNSGSQSELVVARPLDIIFLLDAFEDFTVDPDSSFAGWIDTSLGYGITGHSFGAFTTLAVADMDDRIVAAMPMALGTGISEDYDAATFLMLGTEDKTIGLNGNQGVRNTYADAPQPRYIAEIVDGGHYSFSFACEVGLSGPWDGDGCGEGTRFSDGSTFTFVDDLRVWDIIDGYSAAFFGRYVKEIKEYDSTLATNLDPEITLYTADPGE